MKKFLILIIGVIAGVVVVRKLQETKKGKAFFDSVDARAREFSNAVKDGYSTRDRELRGE